MLKLIIICKVQKWVIDDERWLTDSHRPSHGICSPLQSPVVHLLGRHNSVSPRGTGGPCSNPAVLKCPSMGPTKNCHPVWSSLLGSFPVGPPRLPGRRELCLQQARNTFKEGNLHRNRGGKGMHKLMKSTRLENNNIIEGWKKKTFERKNFISTFSLVPYMSEWN